MWTQDKARSLLQSKTILISLGIREARRKAEREVRYVFIRATRSRPAERPPELRRPPAGLRPYFRTEIFIAAPEAALT
ncbi:hypothetical protein RR46_10804 [Papilio xuthus]|uniref:Uncharacterized protein n=1 Tax=Papilio xuthus TaxID=66420 RepID=A0A194PLD4_PAPXU|nr:hypothetical protein RR46_10804 [Papilio xuthus]